MQVFSRNTLLSTFLMVLPFMLYGWSSRLHGSRSHCSPPLAGRGAPNGATAKWALLTAPSQAQPPSALAGPAVGSSLVAAHHNPGPPPPPRTPGFPFPPIASLAAWLPSDPLPGLRGTCWMLRSLAPRPKDAPPDYPDFLYEACWGDRIKQVPHPYTENRVVFGAFAGWREPDAGAPERYVQVYTGGTVCEGWGSREATVKFLCEPSAVHSPRIREVVEGEVCKYTVLVETAEAC
jgi:hypothetical protein